MTKFAVGILMSLPILAQDVISAKAGLVNLIQGEVTVNDSAIVLRNSKYQELKNGDVLRTSDGRAEVLMAPGVFLRMPPNSAFRMESNSILSTRIALLDGEALLEVVEFAKDTSMEVLIGADKVSVQKAGLYRFDAATPSVRVYDGELAVVAEDQIRKVGEGRVMTLTGDHLVSKFDKKSTDEFTRWAGRRASYISMANISAAKSISNGYEGMGFGSGMPSGWVFNPWFGLYTYMPFSRTLYSPFGYGYYTPSSVYYVLNPRPSYGYSGGNSGWGASGGTGMGPTMGGYDRGGMRSGGGYGGGGGFNGGTSVGAAPPPSVSGGERAAGSGASQGARGGVGGGGRAN